MSERQYTAIMLFGAPGTGKGTQGKILGAIPGFCHVSSGDIFRSLDPDSESGKTFHAHSSKGELVPDELTIRIWNEHMQRLEADGSFVASRDLLVLDGIPRSVQQAELMSRNVDVMRLVHLVCSDPEQMVTRLRLRAEKENRVDDAKEDVIRNRMKVYRDETRPVLDHYDQSLVSEVDALGTPVEVLQSILEAVVPAYSDRFGNALA